MGMDIYGNYPGPLKGQEVQGNAIEEAFNKLQQSVGPFTEDGYKGKEWYDRFHKLDEKSRDAFMELQDMVKKYNPGEYFRANIWSWRPIHMFCETVIQHNGLSIDTDGWGENSGYGIETQEECDVLADAFNPILESLEDAISLIDADKESVITQSSKNLRSH